MQKNPQKTPRCEYQKVLLKVSWPGTTPDQERKNRTILLLLPWKWLILTVGASLLPEATCGQLPSEPAGAAHLITRLGLFPFIWKPLPLAWLGPCGASCSCYLCYGFKGSHSDSPVNDVYCVPVACQGFCAWPWSREQKWQVKVPKEEKLRGFLLFQIFFACF